jgi:COP9 signalosome complex subunit 4
MEETIAAIDKAIGQCDYNSIINIFHVQWNRLGTGEQRSVASHFIQRAVSADEAFVTSSLPMLLDTYQTALMHLPATVENAADTILRRILFRYLVDNEPNEYATAARILAGTRIHESGVYQMDSTVAADLFVSVAECFLQQDDEGIAEADAAVTKAGHYMAEATKEAASGHAAVPSVSLLLRYKTTNARVLDANRKFSAAARSYHELSQHEAIDEQLQLLARAVTCAILDHSNQRYKVLAGLIGGTDGRVRDNTLAAAEPEFAPHAEMAVLMHRKQIVPPRLVCAVEATLADHQKAVTTTHNLTILQRSVVQHNLHAVSILYESIHLTTLAHILNIGGDHNNDDNTNNQAKNIKMAEQITAQMIQEKGMVASIDAVDGMVDFHSSSTGSNNNNNGVGAEPPPAAAASANNHANEDDAADDVAWYRQLNATVHAIQAERKLLLQQPSGPPSALPPVVL